MSALPASVFYAPCMCGALGGQKGHHTHKFENCFPPDFHLLVQLIINK